MVTLDGKIGPFRIDREDLIELVTALEQKLVILSSSIREISITVENFKENCNNVDEFKTFLHDMFLPKVAKEVTIWIWARPSVYLSFSDSSARYSINDAKNTGEARSFEDIILTFFKKHRVSRIFTSSTPYILSSPLLIGTILLFAMIIRSFTSGSYLQYRGVLLFGCICIVTFSLYAIWSSTTKETPPASFFHSILYIEQPKSNIPWAFVSSIVGGLLVSIIWSLVS